MERHRTKIPSREYAFGIFLMSIGVLLNIFYWMTEIIIRKKGFYEDFMEDPVAHTLIILSIPVMMFVGHEFIQERRLRAQVEEAGRIKKLFLDILRHDLLNPAGVIDNYIDLLLEDARRSEKNDLLAMKRAARKLLEIIDDATKFAKLENVTPDFKEVDLDKILREVIEDFKPVFEEAGMKVEYRSRGSLPLRASVLLYDVFANLLGNAIKYAREGGRVIIEVEDEGDSCVVRVKDFGEGVPDEFKEVIFERFKRKEKRGVKGSGLGLAIVKRIVEMHGGEVWVEDNSPKGAVFVVRLPKSAED
ncbi:sensor histidine kinase [Candidatus Pyrohabitans sp.]